MALDPLAFLDENVTDRMSRKMTAAVLRGQFVKSNGTDGQSADLVDTADTDRAIGVAEHGLTAQNITDGVDQLQIAIGGRVAVLAGAAVTIGDTIQVDGSGDGIPVGVVATVLYQTVGIALSSAADTEFFTMLIAPGAHFGANAS